MNNKGNPFKELVYTSGRHVLKQRMPSLFFYPGLVFTDPVSYLLDFLLINKYIEVHYGAEKYKNKQLLELNNVQD